MVELEATNKADVKRKLLLMEGQVDVTSQVSGNLVIFIANNSFFYVNRNVYGSCVGRREKN